MRHASLTVICSLLAGIVLASGAAHAELAPVQSTIAVKVRPSTDGPGPSHVLTLGKYFLVVDPLDATITRYPLAGTTSATVACTFTRDFSPWRSVVKASGVWLVAEDDRQAMLLTPAFVETMGGKECPTITTPSSAVIAPPRFTRGTSAAIVHLANPTGGPRLTIDALRTGSIIDARVLGTMPGGRTVVFWKRLEALPRASEPKDHAERYLAQGRVFVSLFVTIFDRGGTPITQHRVRDFEFVSTGDGIQAAYSGMKKRGFEYLALGSDNALYGLTSENKDFVVKRFNLLNAAPDADIRLASANSVVDNEGEVADVDPVEEPVARGAADGSWQRKLTDSAEEFINVTWRIPPGGFASPCLPTLIGDKGDRCHVMYRDGRLVQRDAAVVDAGAATAVLNGENGPIAEWARPRFLVGRADGYVGTGVPYSFGGDSGPEDLRAFRPEVTAPASYNATPFGHIVEELVLARGKYLKGTYPLGIDCSHLIDRLLAFIGATKAVVPDAGTAPSIPRGWFATPIEHARDLKMGDIFIKDGHVVIFAKTVQIGGPGPARRGQARLQGAVGYVVYEATSRCGRVCRSVYGLDFFNGWWMLRPRTIAAAGGAANSNGAPTWVSRTVAAAYPRPNAPRRSTD